MFNVAKSFSVTQVRLRIKWQPREKAAILYLRRRFGYSINLLAEAFSRSRSMIHKVCKFNEAIGALRWLDNRCYPGRIKKIAATRMQRQLARFLKKYDLFILGQEAEPP